MKKALKRILIVVGVVVTMAVTWVYVVFLCPSLWAKNFPVDPALNVHLASLSLESAEDAAYEAIYWNVDDSERITKAKVASQVTPDGTNQFTTVTFQPMKDDSYNTMYHEIVLTRVKGRWSVLRHRRCWTGRNLMGWSTRIPS